LTKNDLSILNILKAATVTLLAGVGIVFKSDSIERHVFKDDLLQDGTNLIFNKNGILLSDLKIKPFWTSIKGFPVIYYSFVNDSGT
jgi:hypothetical protein